MSLRCEKRARAQCLSGVKEGRKCTGVALWGEENMYMRVPVSLRCDKRARVQCHYGVKEGRGCRVRMV